MNNSIRSEDQQQSEYRTDFQGEEMESLKSLRNGKESELPLESLTSERNDFEKPKESFRLQPPRNEVSQSREITNNTRNERSSSSRVYPENKDDLRSKKAILKKIKAVKIFANSAQLSPYYEFLKLEKSTSWSTRKSLEVKKQQLLKQSFSQTCLKEIIWTGASNLDEASTQPFMLGSDTIGFISLRNDPTKNSTQSKKLILSSIKYKNLQEGEEDEFEEVELHVDPKKITDLSNRSVYYLPGLNAILLKLADNQQGTLGRFLLINKKTGKKIFCLKADEDSSFLVSGLDQIKAPLSWNLESRICIFQNKDSDVILKFDRFVNLSDRLDLKEIDIEGFDYDQKFDGREALIWRNGFQDFFVCHNQGMITVQKLGPKSKSRGFGGLAKRFGDLQCIFQKEIRNLFNLKAIIKNEILSSSAVETQKNPVILRSSYTFCQNMLITPLTNQLVVSFNSKTEIDLGGERKSFYHFFFIILDPSEGRVIEKRFKVRSLFSSKNLEGGYSIGCLENETAFYISPAKHDEIQMIELIQGSKLSRLDPISNPAVRTGVCHINLGVEKKSSLFNFEGKCRTESTVCSEKRGHLMNFRLFDVERLANHQLWSNVIEYERNLKLNSEDTLAKIQAHQKEEKIECTKIQISSDNKQLMVVLKKEKPFSQPRCEILFYDLLGSTPLQAIESESIKTSSYVKQQPPKLEPQKRGENKFFYIDGVENAPNRTKFFIDDEYGLKTAVSPDFSFVILFGLFEQQEEHSAIERNRGKSCGLIWVKNNHKYELCRELIRLEGASSGDRVVEIELFDCQNQQKGEKENFGGLIISRYGKAPLVQKFCQKPTGDHHHLREDPSLLNLRHVEAVVMDSDDQSSGSIFTPEWIKPVYSIQKNKIRHQTFLNFLWKSRSQPYLLISKHEGSDGDSLEPQTTALISSVSKNLQKENVHFIPETGWIIAGSSIFAKISMNHSNRDVDENQSSYFELQRLQNQVLKIYASQRKSDYLYCLEEQKRGSKSHKISLFELTELGMTQLKSYSFYGDHHHLEISKDLNFLIQAENLSSNINDPRFSEGFQSFKERVGTEVYLKSRKMAEIGQKQHRLVGFETQRDEIWERIIQPQTWFDFDKSGKQKLKIDWKNIEKEIEEVSDEIDKGFYQDLEYCKMLKELKKEWISSKESESKDTLNQYLPDKTEQVKSWKEDQILGLVHTKYNLLFLAVCRRDSKRLEHLLNSFGYHPYLYPQGFNPFMAALDVGDFGSLNVIKEFIQKAANPKNQKKEENSEKSETAEQSPSKTFSKHLWAFMDEDQFVQTIKSGHKGIQDLIVSQLFNEDMYAHLEEFEDKAHHKPFERINQYPMDDDTDVKTIKMGSTRMNRMDHARIEETVTEAVRAKEPTASVKFNSMRVKLNPGIQHQSCVDFLEALTLVSDEHLSGDLRHVIHYIWRANKWKVVLPFVIFEWITMILFFTQIVLNDKSFLLAFLIILFSVTELVLNIMEALRNSRKYFRTATNYIDIIQYTSMPLISTLVHYTNIIESSSTSVNFVINLVVIFSGFRGITGLKIFDNLRYQIAMLLQVFADITSLLIITTCSIFVFSVVEISHQNKENPDYEGWLQMREHLNYYLNTVFGNWSDSAKDFAVDRYFFYVLSGLFFSFILANFVIGVINTTFENFEEEKELVDTEQILDMLLESAYVLGYFRKGGITQKDREGMCYICLIERVGGDGEDPAQGLEEKIERLTEELPKLIGDLERRVERVTKEGLKEIVAGIDKKQERFSQGILDQIRELRQAVLHR